VFSLARGIILACDVDDLDTLASLVEESRFHHNVVGYKIGFSLALRYGLGRTAATIRSATELPIIYDHQKGGTDVPQMGEPFARCCSEAGMNGVIIFPHAGPETMRAFIEAVDRHSMVPIVGVVMTHTAYLGSQGGFINDEAPSRICSQALDMGVKHFVLPGNRPEYLRRYSQEISSKMSADISALMPGIGAQGGQIKLAFESTNLARCYAIIGSAIYASAEPAKALEEFTNQILDYERDN
jgi:orotidine-5'-phosphate decarboxylase